MTYDPLLGKNLPRFDSKPIPHFDSKPRDRSNGAAHNSPPTVPQDDPGERKPVLMTSEEFTRGFVPPDYLVDGMLQRRYLYSLTAPTGSGKTAILLRLAYCVSLCQAMGRYQIEASGPVCYFAGENPDDVRMRWIAMAEKIGFDRK